MSEMVDWSHTKKPDWAKDIIRMVDSTTDFNPDYEFLGSDPDQGRPAQLVIKPTRTPYPERRVMAEIEEICETRLERSSWRYSIEKSSEGVRVNHDVGIGMPQA